jgi:hypothetical protein
MGKMKELFIDEINNHPHDHQQNADWNYEEQHNAEMAKNAKYEPQPLEVREDGKKLYLIKDYKIWAQSYQQALGLLPLIESF